MLTLVHTSVASQQAFGFMIDAPVPAHCSPCAEQFSCPLARHTLHSSPQGTQVVVVLQHGVGFITCWPTPSHALFSFAHTG